MIYSGIMEIRIALERLNFTTILWDNHVTLLSNTVPGDGINSQPYKKGQGITIITKVNFLLGVIMNLKCFTCKTKYTMCILPPSIYSEKKVKLTSPAVE